jgi:hypothetical protein
MLGQGLRWFLIRGQMEKLVRFFRAHTRILNRQQIVRRVGSEIDVGTYQGQDSMKRQDERRTY